MLFDDLINLQEEFDLLSTTLCKFTNAAVTKTYFGQEYVSRKMKMHAYMAVMLSRRLWVL